MPVTGNFELPYAEGTDPPAGFDQTKALAQAIDTTFAPFPSDIANLQARMDAQEFTPHIGQVVYHGRRVNVQSIANTAQNDSATVIAWDSNVLDVGGVRDAQPDNTRLRPPVAGWYRFEGKGCTEAATTPVGENRIRDCGFKKNGVQIPGSVGREQVVTIGNAEYPAGGNAVGITVSANPVVVDMDGTNDFVQMWVKQESGGPLNTLADLDYVPTVMVTYVGPL